MTNRKDSIPQTPRQIKDNWGHIRNGSILKSADAENIVNADLGDLGIITENL